MNLESLLITRGKDGMVVFPRRHKPVDIPIYGSDEVADVTGAGDTVDRDFYRCPGCGRNRGRGRAPGELCGRHRGDEARHGHGQPAGIAGGAG